MAQAPVTTRTVPQDEQHTHDCAGCGREVPETDAVLLPCCDTEWACPACHTGGTDSCEACFDAEDQIMVRGLR